MAMRMRAARPLSTLIRGRLAKERALRQISAFKSLIPKPESG
jgi:hypothetical protein